MQIRSNNLFHLWGLLPQRVAHAQISATAISGTIGANPFSIQWQQIDALTVHSGSWFDSLELTVADERYLLRGLESKAVARFVGNTKQHLLQAITQTTQWQHLLQLAERYQQQHHYFSSSEWQPLANVVRLGQKLTQLALQPEQFRDPAQQQLLRFAQQLSSANITELGRNHYNQQVVPRLLQRHQRFFDTVEKMPLSERQRQACVTNDDHNLVVAGAGTGKTSTLVGKAGYLVAAGLAQPEEILLLAFGNKAAEEMNQRLAQRLPTLAKQFTASTFHGFGNRIVAHARGHKASLTQLVEQEEQLQRFVQEALETQLTYNAAYQQQLLVFFASYSTPAKTQFDFDSIEAYHEFISKCRLITLQGEFVKSIGELRIANLLYLWGIDYRYEMKYEHPTASLEHGQYKPDFYLPEAQLYLEFFGINKQGHTAPFVDQQQYWQGIEWKRQLHQDKQTKLAELYSHQLSDGSLETELERLLSQHQLHKAPLDPTQALQQLQQQQHSPWRGFCDLVIRFLGLYKEGQHNLDELRQQLDADSGYDVARSNHFFDLFEPLLDAYQRHLKLQGEIDFADMIALATERLQQRQFNHGYRYVLVDEFQDLSTGRGRLLNALLQSRPNMRLFAVGDDWQAIYRFNGSDLRFFTRFDHAFSPAQMLLLDKSYRFNNRIHQLSSTFVMANPEQLQKQIHTHTQVQAAAVRLVNVREQLPQQLGQTPQQYKLAANAQALQRALAVFSRHAAKHQPDRVAQVLVVGRYSAINMRELPELTPLQASLPNLNVSYKTAHASKGLEADYVVVIGLDQGAFPSVKNHDELIDQVLPQAEQFSFAEERRLFYVALTRAKHFVYVLFDGDKPSPFVLELARLNKELVEHSGAPLVQHRCPKCQQGQLKRLTSKYQSVFYVCSLKPACDHTERACPECSSPMPTQPQGFRRCVNRDCGQIDILCLRCGIGTMKIRNNQPGKEPFYGCSRYRRDAEDCCRENIKTEAYQQRLQQAKRCRS
ncbi:UvrD-helicase domain-containing protein [uncultured Ferrimonas sp.]|uniref:UvrD-helicase domain-containing protein n=1 Tax=uncultured Ferrimonas sp. TaxID=432640 RepID=UPI0026016591|nr:UvrD-helicase domain-containing protein [uncultured Ferrimonas sp.]